MGRAVSVVQRQVILERAEHGDRAGAIAADLGLEPETVRKLMNRFRARGAEGLAPSYDHCGSCQSRRSDPELIEVAIELRREHPTWGAGLIRVILRDRHPGQTIPSERALQRAFVRADLNPAPAGRRSTSSHRRAAQPHEVWQLDAAEHMALGGGREASWVRIADECSGAVLLTAVFPPRRLEQCPRLGDSGVPAPGVCPMGDAPTAPGRQRDSVGFKGRPADRFGVMAGWLGRRGPCEPAAATPGQWRRRAVTGHRQAVGGTAPRRIVGGAPGIDRRDGSNPA
jgi:hypothetical protein